MNRVTAIVLIAAQLVFMLPPRALADDSDIFGANINPNVVFIIDNSGSMSDDAPSNAYDPSNTYPVLTKCDPSTTKKPTTTTWHSCTSEYVFRGSKYDHYANSVSSVSSSSARNALNSSGYWSGSINGSNLTLYTGNYVNYLLGSCSSGGSCMARRP